MFVGAVSWVQSDKNIRLGTLPQFFVVTELYLNSAIFDQILNMFLKGPGMNTYTIDKLNSI